MKLNPDCIRDVLLEVEKAEYMESLSVNDLYQALHSYQENDINYTIIKLQEAGLIDASIRQNITGAVVIDINDITYDGHQFLANIREENIWFGVKDIAKKVGSTSVNAFTQIASNVISELIKAHFGIGIPGSPNV